MKSSLDALTSQLISSWRCSRYFYLLAVADGLPLISNHSIQPLFKSNQFFFELSKLTSLNEGRKRDLNEKLFTARVALWNSDPNTKNPVEVAVSKRDPNTKNPVGVALSKRDPCCKKFHMGRAFKERPIWVIFKKKKSKIRKYYFKGRPILFIL